MAYRVELLPAAVRDIEALAAPVRERIAARIDALAAAPRPHGAEKLSGHDKRWRIRVGDYRVIYEVHDQRVLVLVVRVGHRREMYR